MNQEITSHKSSLYRLTISLLFGVLYTAVLVAGSSYSGSLSIMANAGHMLLHTGTLLIAILASFVAFRASKKCTRSHKSHVNNCNGDEEYNRIELLGGYTNGLILLGVGLWVMYSAISRWYGLEMLGEFGHEHGYQELNVSVMGAVSLIGLVLHSLSAWVLYKGRKLNLNVHAAFLHIFFDVLATVLALLTAVVIHFTDYEWLDNLTSLIIAILILVSAIRLITHSMRQLVGGVSNIIDYKAVAESLQSISHIQDVHNIVARKNSRGELTLSAHLVLEGDCVHSNHWNSCRLEAEKILKQKFKINYSILQMESLCDH